MEQQDRNRYEILRKLAIAGSRREDLKQTAEIALRQAADLVGLQSAALYLWDDNGEVTISISHAENEDVQQTMTSLETDLFHKLRQQSQMTSAYISFGGDFPMQSFTLPLRYGKNIFGAVIGIQQGEQKLISEDAFLEALSSSLALYVVAEGIGKDHASRDSIDKERLGAIVETAVTVNHEVNNPLTAILGNVQLLLMKRENLDEELVEKLKTIELSAMKIRDVTQKLLKVKSAKSIAYADGTMMLDINQDEENNSPE